jgi:hypothetical protein
VDLLGAGPDDLFCQRSLLGKILAHFYRQTFPLDWGMRIDDTPTRPWTGFRERGEWSAKPLKLARIFRRVAARPL